MEKTLNKIQHPWRNAVGLYFLGVFALALFAFGCKGLLMLL